MDMLTPGKLAQSLHDDGQQTAACLIRDLLQK
jgi:hypothetical protein